MQTIIDITEKYSKQDNPVFLITDIKDIDKKYFSEDEFQYIKSCHKEHKKELFSFNHFDHWIFVQFIKKEKIRHLRLESYRAAGAKLLKTINENKLHSIVIVGSEAKPEESLAFAEGMALCNYQFLKYKKKPAEKINSLNTIYVYSHGIEQKAVDELNIMIDGTNKCRNLVNEPVVYLNAVNLAEEIKSLGKKSGAKVEVLNKKKIEALKMGGLLAVNKGSVDPPTFTIMEWKPDKPVNKKPYVFVGKGVVYDTGGMNLKPGEYMNNMKMDMAGGAAVASAVYAIATARLPVHVIGLIPATDNRTTGNAYVSSDIITMYDGTKVEVINTDAEGRLILADALSYAKKFDPVLVIDVATLTGSAARAIGKYGIVAMFSQAGREFNQLKKSGENVCERIVEFPFWEEYEELIKSDVADIKNIGGTDAGAITAGKFLEHFTDYPFIHLDVAGPAFIEKSYKYYPIGGTGIAVRLLFDFIKRK
ncbi:MAG: leucyl aminopeptidase [Bacteroidales bacterium]|nr:leucyl aminopeptidase [Bacteroidales bacterium]